MKKEVSKPLMFSVIGLVVLVVGFFAFRSLSGPAEFESAPVNVGPEGAVPAYMKDKMSPEMQKMIEEQTAKYGTKSNASAPVVNPGN